MRGFLDNLGVLFFRFKLCRIDGDLLWFLYDEVEILVIGVRMRF